MTYVIDDHMTYVIDDVIDNVIDHLDQTTSHTTMEPAALPIATLRRYPSAQPSCWELSISAHVLSFSSSAQHVFLAVPHVHI